MKLYFAPRTASTRVRWLLEELDVPYELVRVEPAWGAEKTPELLAISPFGELPALVDGELKLFDTAAMVLHLVDRHPSKGLAPAPGSPDRARHDQALLLAERQLEPVLKELLRLAMVPDETRVDLAKHQARAREVLQVIDRGLDGREHLVGGRFTAADLVTASLLHLANHVKALEAFPRLAAYLGRHVQRPAIRRAMA